MQLGMWIDSRFAKCLLLDKVNMSLTELNYLDKDSTLSLFFWVLSKEQYKL